jgi:H+/Cl- antiporter ClcA
LFFGYETLGNILKNETKEGWLSLLTLTSLKLSLTASSLGSGLIGGIFAPSLFLGATLGAAWEQVHKLASLPLLDLRVGMTQILCLI